MSKQSTMLAPVSAPVQNLTVPPAENLTDRRGRSFSSSWRTTGIPAHGSRPVRAASVPCGVAHVSGDPTRGAWASW
jgi:hypothetical protein